jgi:hypothetical protein
MPIEGQVAWFPIDHIIPRSRGGGTVLDNLAMSCPRCNGHKWAADAAEDPETAEVVPLFHPRQQVWVEHFRWSTSADHEIEGLTPCGRATVKQLKMNDPEIIAIRRVLVEMGLRFRHRQ